MSPGRSLVVAVALAGLAGCDGEVPAPVAAASSGLVVEPELVAVPATPVEADEQVAQDVAPVIVAPEPGGPPEDFGAIRPVRPPPADGERTVHALASFEVVTVYSLPNLASPRLGYLRIGARAMVTPRIDDLGEGCEKGFHALAAGGFVCASKGLVVDAQKAPYLYLPPPPPRLAEPIPYDYGAIGADGTPMWWRIPDAEEVMLAGQKYRAIVAAQEAKAAAEAGAEAPAAKPKAKPKQADDAGGAGDTGDAAAPAEASPAPSEPAPLPGIEDLEAPPPVELTAEEKAAIAKREAQARKRAEERKKREAEQERALARKRARLPLNSQTPFMEAGFVVTLADKVRQQGGTWWKTTRGGYVQASRVYRKQTHDFVGGEIPAEGRHAFGFVESERGGSASARDEKGELKWKRKLEHRQFLAFAEEVTVGRTAYLVTPDGLFVRKGDLRLAVPATRPEEVAAWERWIDVDLERQMLVAYEGDVPVYATLISSGKRGTAEESFLTPKGRYRITAKHVSSSMDGNAASDGRYSIQDVPWAMFFSGNYALHGAFWHQKFGERRSHGCVNLGPSDARWLFLWTTPFVPEGWHGVNAHEGAPGSMVVIH